MCLSTNKWQNLHILLCPLLHPTLMTCAQVALASDPLLSLLHGGEPGSAAPPFSHQSSLSSDELRLPGLGAPEAATPILAIAAATVHEARRDPRANAPTDDELRCMAMPHCLPTSDESVNKNYSCFV